MPTPAADVTSRAMRSSTNCDYFVRRTTLRLGDRAFSVAAPLAWNRLTSELKTTTCSIETFKIRLKTFSYLILLLVLIHRDNIMRHCSVCRGRTSRCCNCNCNKNGMWTLRSRCSANGAARRLRRGQIACTQANTSATRRPRWNYGWHKVKVILQIYFKSNLIY